MRQIIRLNKTTTTNVELAQSLEMFVYEAIQKNPEGFLEMYLARSQEERQDLFYRYITIYDGPDEAIINTFNKLAKNSTLPKYREEAANMVQMINKYFESY